MREQGLVFWGREDCKRDPRPPFLCSLPPLPRRGEKPGVSLPFPVAAGSAAALSPAPEEEEEEEGGAAAAPRPPRQPRPAPGPAAAAQSVRRGRRCGAIKAAAGAAPGAERGIPAPATATAEPSPGNGPAGRGVPAPAPPQPRGAGRGSSALSPERGSPAAVWQPADRPCRGKFLLWLFFGGGGEAARVVKTDACGSVFLARLFSCPLKYGRPPASLPGGVRGGDASRGGAGSVGTRRGEQPRRSGVGWGELLLAAPASPRRSSVLEGLLKSVQILK